MQDLSNTIHDLQQAAHDNETNIDNLIASLARWQKLNDELIRMYGEL